MPSLPILLPPLLVLLCQDDARTWSGFRGDNGCGLSAARGLPGALDPAHNLRWRVAVPAGYSSPIVADGEVFLTGASEVIEGKTVSGRLVTLCLDASTGETRWRRELEFRGARPGRSLCAAPSPVTDGEIVVALFHHLGLLAFDRAGKELWRRPLGPFAIPHGLSSSPLLLDGLVVVQVDQDNGSYLAAFEASSGAPRWRVERAEIGHGYATPIVHRPADGPAELIVSSALQVAGYSLANGEKLWWLGGPGRQPKGVPVLADGRCFVKSFQPALSEMRVPALGSFAENLAQHDGDHDQKLSRAELAERPRWLAAWSDIDQDGDDLLDASEWELATSSATGGLFAIRLGGRGDVSGSHLAWKRDDRRSLDGLAAPLIVEHTMFLLGDGGLLTSLALESGEIRKQERLGEPDSYCASPVAGDGKLYLASLSGLLQVVSAAPEWELFSSHLLEGAEIRATPALAGKAVFVRSTEELCCFADPD